MLLPLWQGASPAQRAALRLVCATLWLSSGSLLRAALDAGSADSIFYLAEAAAQVRLANPMPYTPSLSVAGAAP